MSTRKSWRRLDNAAKIFPPNATSRNTKVFRFACELTELVDGDKLGEALSRTVPEFPLFRSVLKKGFFWYYLEESDLPLRVEEEAIPICSPLYYADEPGLLFRVTYYRYRINLEVFHALADGSGAAQFMRVLVFNYLAEKYAIPGQLDDYDASPEQKCQDAFYRYYDKSGKKVKADHSRAYCVSGEYLPEHQMSAVEGYMSVKALIEKAHEYNATLSEFLISLLICAIFEGMAVREHSKPVVISVPVDLRKYFASQTACNFFAVVHIRHRFGKDNQSFDDVLENVRSSLKRQLTRDNLSAIISKFSAIENKLLIKAVPLVLKIPALALYGSRVQVEETATFSNIGGISMPEEAAGYIKLFNVFVSTKRPQVCVCSFGDTLAISLASRNESMGIERRFIRSLTAMGIDINVVTNLEQIYSYGEDAPEKV